MRLEFKMPQEVCKNGNKMYHVVLDRLAVKESVEMSKRYNKIIPNFFDVYGHPYFSISESIDTDIQVIYKEDIFDLDRDQFDTLDGVEKSLVTISKFNSLICNRKRFIFSNIKEELNEFLVFGHIKLSKDGSAVYVRVSKSKRDVNISDRVVSVKDLENNSIYLECLNGVCIPEADEYVCNGCNEIINIGDIKSGNLLFLDGMFFHKKCFFKRKNNIFLGS